MLTILYCVLPWEYLNLRKLRPRAERPAQGAGRARTQTPGLLSLHPLHWAWNGRVGGGLGSLALQ